MMKIYLYRSVSFLLVHILMINFSLLLLLMQTIHESMLLRVREQFPSRFVKYSRVQEKHTNFVFNHTIYISIVKQLSILIVIVYLKFQILYILDSFYFRYLIESIRSVNFKFWWNRETKKKRYKFLWILNQLIVIKENNVSPLFR